MSAVVGQMSAASGTSCIPIGGLHGGGITTTIPNDNGCQPPNAVNIVEVEKMTSCSQSMCKTLQKWVDASREDDAFLAELNVRLKNSDDQWNIRLDHIIKQLLAIDIDATSKQTIWDLEEKVRLLTRQVIEKESIIKKHETTIVDLEAWIEKLTKKPDPEPWKVTLFAKVEEIRNIFAEIGKGRDGVLAEVTASIIALRSNKNIPDITVLEEVYKLFLSNYQLLSFLMVLGKQELTKPKPTGCGFNFEKITFSEETGKITYEESTIEKHNGITEISGHQESLTFSSGGLQ